MLVNYLESNCYLPQLDLYKAAKYVPSNGSPQKSLVKDLSNLTLLNFF